MSPRLDVRVATFDDAAQTLIGDGVAAMYGPAVRLVAVLDDGAGMAGADPPARDWASAYDAAASTLLTSIRLLCDAVYRVGVLLERAGSNYAHAESASTAGGGPVPPALRHDPAWQAVLGTPPSAGGGGGADAPTGWGLVEDLVGYVWPNGHQDRLRSGAAAWTSAAEGADDAARQLLAAGCELCTVDAPDIDAAIDTIRRLRDRCTDLAHAQRRLARSCESLADRIDDAHAAVRSELASLVAFTAGTEAVGAVLSVVTLGAAEVPTQAAVAARIGVAATAVRTVLGGAAAAVRTLAAGLPGVAETAEAVAVAARQVLQLRPVLAGVEDARALPMLSKAGRAAKGAGTAGRATTRAKVLSKAESKVWQATKRFRGKTRTNGKTGAGQRFYEWDHTHGDIEVYDSDGWHLGSMDAVTGAMTKPALKGRRIRV